MSGGLPPRTAVSTFCSVLSLLTYRLLTFCPGFSFWYWATRWVNVLASAPVQPSQIEMLDPPPPPPPPLLLSVPHAASPSASAVSPTSGPARVARSRFLAMLLSLSGPQVLPNPVLPVTSTSEPGGRSKLHEVMMFRAIL